MMKLTGLDTWTSNDTLQVVIALISGVILISGVFVMISRIGV